MLLAYVDGELSRQTAKKVKLHLEGCWECRARMTDLDHQAQELARMSALQTFPSPDRIEKGRSEFFARVDDCERRSVEAAPRFGSGPFVATRSLSALVGIAVVCAIGIALWQMKRQARPKADEVLAAASRSERSFYQSGLPVYQAFQVQIEVNQPQPSSRTSHLEVWSQGQGRGFASRWKDEQGVLKLGSWRTHPGQQYVYDANLSKQVRLEEEAPRQSFLLAELSEYGLRAEELERGFMQWIRGQSWKPISLAQEMSLFCSEEGVLLRVESLFSHPRGRVLRLSAERMTSGGRVELVLEVDPVTYRPRLTTVRFEIGRRVVQLQVILERAEYVKASRAVFEPDFPIAEPGWKGVSPDSVSETRPKVPTQLVGPGLVELERAEVDVRYILHQLGACLGEPVEIVRQASGICVRGVVETTARKQQLLSHLAEYHKPPNVKFDIRTVDEVLEEQSRLAASPDGSGAKAAVEKAPPSRGPVTHFTATRLPIQSHLREYFQQQSAGGSPPTGESGKTAVDLRVTRFCNDALSEWRSAFKHGWALRRLLERYAETQVRNLPPESRRLLERMVRDHTVTAERLVGRVRALVEPALSAIAKPGSERGHGIQSPLKHVAPQDRAESGWFSRADRIDRLIHGLLAGDALPVWSNADQTAGVQEDGTLLTGAVYDLLAEFGELENELAAFESQVAEELSVEPGLALSPSGVR